ncbi:MAG TPA: DUF4296 domain-containing protein [Chitinophagales bacterium]|nr:DUF4296 domain-containing protein [Chitinophagales bacterium]
MNIVLLSCNNTPNSDNTVAVLQATIPKEQMINILADIHLVEARTQEVSLRRFDTTLQKMDSIDNYYKIIFTKYGVKEKDFLNSFNAYATDQKTFDEMYDKVLERLSRIDARLR